MNKYKYYVELCGGYCNGLLTVEAKNEEEARDKAMDSFVNRWVKTYPELDVDYNVELYTVEIDKDEIKRKLQKACELLPLGEELEINSDGYEVTVLRYLESRGSAECIEGLEDNVLWYEDDVDLDENFNPEDVVKGYADAYCL